MNENQKSGLAAELESAFEKARTEREAREAAQLAADSVPTDNIAVLRERATRHATEAIDSYWGYFGDMQKELTERVITPLLSVVERLVSERDAARKELEPYEVLNPQQCPAGKHADWLVDSEHTHTCPWCELEKAQARVADWNGTRDALAQILKHGDMSDTVRQEIALLLSDEPDVDGAGRTHESYQPQAKGGA